MKSENLISVELVLENCELILVKGEHILEYRQPCVALLGNNGNLHFSEFYIKISKQARIVEPKKFIIADCDEERDTFDRILSRKDLCQVLLEYDNSALHCYVPYNRNINELALGKDSYRLDEDGNLIIHLKSTPKTEEWLLKERFINFKSKPLVQNGKINEEDDEDEYVDDEFLGDGIDVYK